MLGCNVPGKSRNWWDQTHTDSFSHYRQFFFCRSIRPTEVCHPFAVHTPYSLSSKVLSFRLRALGFRARSRTQLRLTGEQYCLPNTLNSSLFSCPRSNPTLSLSLSSTSNPTQPSATTPAVPAISSSWDLPQNMSAMFRAKGGPTDPRAKTDTLCGPSECKIRSIIVVYSIS